MENPILRREFRAILRSRRAFVLEAVFLLTLCWLTYLFWPATGVYSLAAARSREIFTVLLVGQLTLVVLFSPAFAASALTTEKELGTFDLLYATLLSPSSIVFAKMVSCLAFLVMVIISSLPVACFCLTIGGVGATEVSVGYAIILVAAVSFGLLSLSISSLFARSFSSTLVAYAAVVLLSAGVWLPSLVFSGWEIQKPLFNTIRSFSPFTVLMAVVQPDFYAVLGGGHDVECLRVFLTWSGALMLVCLVELVVVLRRPPRTRAQRRRTMVDDLRTAVKRRLLFPFYLIDPLRRKRMIGSLSNPVFVKELRSKIFTRPAFLIRGMYCCLTISLALLVLAAKQYTFFSPDFVRLTAIVFQLGIVTFVAPSLTSGSITSEKEGANYDMLRLTLLSPASVIYGKFKAAFFFVLMLLLTSVPVFFALSHIEADHSRVIEWAAILVLTTVLCLAIGLFWSSFLPTTALATLASYGTVGFLCVGTLLALFFGPRLGYDVRASLLALNPFASALQVSTDSILQAYNLSRSHMFISGGLSVVLLLASGLRIWHYHRQGD